MTLYQYIICGLGLSGLLIHIFLIIRVKKRQWGATNYALGAAAQAHGGKLHDTVLSLSNMTTKDDIRKKTKPFIVGMPFWCAAVILSAVMGDTSYGAIIAALLLAAGLITFFWGMAKN